MCLCNQFSACWGICESTVVFAAYRVSSASEFNLVESTASIEVFLATEIHVNDDSCHSGWYFIFDCYTLKKEGTHILRNVGTLLVDFGLAYQKAWIFISTVTGISYLANVEMSTGKVLTGYVSHSIHGREWACKMTVLCVCPLDLIFGSFDRLHER
jgi:hypothetical protein